MNGFDFFAIWKKPEEILPVAYGDTVSTAGLVLLGLTAALCAVFLVLFFRRFKNGKRGVKEAVLMGAAVLMFLFFTEWAVMLAKKYARGLYAYFDMILLYETALPVNLFGAGLAVSNLVLLKKEGFKPQNLLAGGLGLLIIAGIHTAFSLNCLTARWIGELFLDVLASFFFLFFVSLFLGLAATCFVYTRHRVPHDRDYVMVPGCAVFGDRVPPLLAGRVERALSFMREQESKTGRAPALILSGGQGKGETISEAEAMKRYCLKAGVPEDRLFIEDRSTNTLENFQNTKRIADEQFPGGKGAYATTNYHVFRSEILSRRTGLDAQGLAADVKWYFLSNAFAREFAAVLAGHKKNVLILLGFDTLCALAITVFQWLSIHPGQSFWG